MLVERRPAEGPLPGQWQFPGGKVEFGEHPWDALRRELKEELRLSVREGRLFGVYSHVYELPRARVHYVLIAYRIPAPRGQVEETEDLRWVFPRTLSSWPVVPGSKPIVADLVRGRRAVT